MATSHVTTTRDWAASYWRESDERQSGGSVQAENLRRLSEKHALDLVLEEHDKGESGDDLERPGLTRLLAMLAKHHKRGSPIRWLLVDQSDRLSRADSIATFTLLGELRDEGVRYIATPQTVFDLYSEMDRTRLHLEADWRNNPFLRMHGKRVLGGLLSVASEGYWTGGAVPFGYCVVKTDGEHAGTNRHSGRLSVDTDQAADALGLFEEYARVGSTRKAARWFSQRVGKRVSARKVARMLRSALYAGTRVFGLRARGDHARVIDGHAVELTEENRDSPADVIRLHCPGLAIVPLPLFLRVQGLLSQGKTRSQKGGNPVHGLSGIARCAGCGRRMVYQSTRDRHYLRCPADRSDCACAGQGIRHGEAFARVKARIDEELIAGGTVEKLAALAALADADQLTRWEAARRGLTERRDEIDAA